MKRGRPREPERTIDRVRKQSLERVKRSQQRKKEQKLLMKIDLEEM